MSSVTAATVIAGASLAVTAAGTAYSMGAFGGKGGQKENPYVAEEPMPDATTQRGTEVNAADEAARKARAEANQRNGARASVLTDASLSDSFAGKPVARKSLLGVGMV